MGGWVLLCTCVFYCCCFCCFRGGWTPLPRCLHRGLLGQRGSAGSSSGSGSGSGSGVPAATRRSRYHHARQTQPRSRRAHLAHPPRSAQGGAVAARRRPSTFQAPAKPACLDLLHSRQGSAACSQPRLTTSTTSRSSFCFRAVPWREWLPVSATPTAAVVLWLASRRVVAFPDLRAQHVSAEGREKAMQGGWSANVCIVLRTGATRRNLRSTVTIFNYLNNNFEKQRDGRGDTMGL